MDKLERLQEILREKQKIVIAFSGGVDSTFLLKVAHDTLKSNCIAVTADSIAVPRREAEDAEEFCKNEGIKQIKFQPNELQLEEYRANTPDRCYYCKKHILKHIKKIAEEYDITNIAEGSNVDDEGDYRPGTRAVKEEGILSPLKEAGLTKAEIREYSKQMGLNTWNKQSMACLASRIPYGEEITEDKLRQVREAEEVIERLGIDSFRVRMHQNIARIEVEPKDFQTILNNREEITEAFKQLGFDYTTLDLKGKRTGSMNEVIDTKK